MQKLPYWLQEVFDWRIPKSNISDPRNPCLGMAITEDCGGYFCLDPRRLAWRLDVRRFRRAAATRRPRSLRADADRPRRVTRYVAPARHLDTHIHHVLT